MPNEALPVISIVTPSFQQGPYLERTLRSVLDQRYPALDYQVMDGGSTDESLAILERYRSRLSRVESGPDGGQSAAIAKGFANAQGEIFAYLNSDDVLLPGTLNFVAAYFKAHPEVDLVYGHRAYIDAEDRVLRHWVLPPHLDYIQRRWDYIPQETCFWRRRLAEKAGPFDPGFHFALDYDFLVRCMAVGRLRRADRFLGAIRLHPASKTTRTWESIGKAEVARIHQREDFWAPRTLVYCYDLWMLYLLKQWTEGERDIPGLPPGIGYDLKALWGDAP